MRKRLIEALNRAAYYIQIVEILDTEQKKQEALKMYREEMQKFLLMKKLMEG